MINETEMDKILSKFDRLFFVIGRSLLGVYFLIPGVMKVAQYAPTLALMQSKGVPLSDALLPLTIFLQIGLGLMLIFGKQLKLSAFLLCGLTLMISLFIHDFWNLTDSVAIQHEMQNFIKNLAIAAGLLVLAARGSIITKQQDVKRQEPTV